MEKLSYYIIEPFYIRAEKISGCKSAGYSNPVIFQLCSIIRGFFILGSKCEDPNGQKSIKSGVSPARLLPYILGVTKRYSATFDDCDSKAVTYRSSTLNRQQRGILGTVAFGQSQQAVFTTEVVHAYFILRVSEWWNRDTTTLEAPTVVNSVIGYCAGEIDYSPALLTFFILPVVSMVRCGLDIDCFRINQPRLKATGFIFGLAGISRQMS